MEELVVLGNKPVENKCGECTACCFVLKVNVGAEVKPSFSKCPNLRDKLFPGCSIYKNRPASCKRYQCLWLKDGEKKLYMRPDQCGLVMHVSDRALLAFAVESKLGWKMKGLEQMSLIKTMVEFCQAETVLFITSSGPKVWTTVSDEVGKFLSFESVPCRKEIVPWLKARKQKRRR